MPIGCMALLKEPVESLPTPGEALPHLVVEMVENSGYAAYAPQTLDQALEGVRVMDSFH